MPISNGLVLPNPLSNGTTADAVAVMADYNYLLTALNRALLDAGGGGGMNAQSTQIHNLANGTAANDAVNLSQLNGYALLSGATFTGALAGTSLSLSSTLGVTGASTLAALTASGLITGNAGFSGTTLTLSGAASLNGGGTSVTPATGDNSTNVATTAFVKAQGYAALASPAFSGVPTAPTAAQGTNTTQLATTAFVQAGRVPNVQSVSSAATVTPTFSNDMVDITAQAVGLTLANPTGTAVNGQGLVVRIKDNGSAQTIAYGAQYVSIGFTKPTTTVAGKVLNLGMIYNGNLTRWEIVSMAQE